MHSQTQQHNADCELRFDRPAFRVIVSLGVGLAWFALAECPNEGASTSNSKRSCQNCSTGEQAQAGSTCSWSESSALIYCDCVSGKKCDKTGNSIPNTQVIQHSGGTCMTGVCHGGDATTVFVTGEEKQSSQCNT